MSSDKYVYIIQGQITRFVKVGITDGPIQRISSIQCCCPEDLDVIKIIAGASRRLEHFLHEKLGHLHIRGEWFKPECLDLIDGLLATADVERMRLEDEAEDAVNQEIEKYWNDVRCGIAVGKRPRRYKGTPRHCLSGRRDDAGRIARLVRAMMPGGK